MKRPAIETLFSPVKHNKIEVAELLLNFFNEQYRGYIKKYYAKINYNEKYHSYSFAEEKLDLKTGKIC